jgi:hypothetical protein
MTRADRLLRLAGRRGGGRGVFGIAVHRGRDHSRSGGRRDGGAEGASECGELFRGRARKGQQVFDHTHETGGRKAGPEWTGAGREGRVIGGRRRQEACDGPGSGADEAACGEQE